MRGNSDKYLLNMKLALKTIRGRLKNAVISRDFDRRHRDCGVPTLKNHSEEIKGRRHAKRSLAV